MEQEFKYDAFLSYKSTDRESAIVLEKELERYRPPTGIHAKGGDRARLDICRDEEDFTGNHLKPVIEEHLRQCRKLILLCSPDAAKSEYVNYEVTYFCNHRGIENVIFVLVAGSPEKDPPEGLNPYPPAVLGSIPEPRCLDFRATFERKRKPRSDSCWWQLLANILDAEVAILQERERRDRAKMRRLATVTVAVVIGSLSATTAWALAQEKKAERHLAQAQAAEKEAVQNAREARVAQDAAEKAQLEAEKNLENLKKANQEKAALNDELGQRDNELAAKTQEGETKARQLAAASREAAEAMGAVDRLIDDYQKVRNDAQSLYNGLTNCRTAYKKERALAQEASQQSDVWRKEATQHYSAAKHFHHQHQVALEERNQCRADLAQARVRPPTAQAMNDTTSGEYEDYEYVDE